MDATEAQLRFGASLTHSVEPSHSNHSISTGVSSNTANIRPARAHGISATGTSLGSRIVGFTTNVESNRSRPERDGMLFWFLFYQFVVHIFTKIIYPYWKKHTCSIHLR